MLSVLTTKVGKEKLDRLLGIAIPSYKQDYAILKGAISQENWSQATRKAHSLKATAALFSAQGFLQCLELVEEKDAALITQKDFLLRLDKEYSSCLQAMIKLSKDA